jgi:hypothetical protein
MVHHQGLMNEKELSGSDRTQIQMWARQKLLEITTIKNPKKIADPMFTHRVRLSDTLFMRAWQIRYEKAAQFSTPIKHHNPDNEDSNDLPNVALYLLTTPQEQLPAPEEPAVTYDQYRQFLELHGHKPTPSQQDIAKDLFQVFGQTRHRALIKMPGTGKTWLLKTLDQFFTWLKNQTN